MGMMPAAKAKDLRGSGIRFLGMLRPHGWMIGAVIALAVVSVALNVAGPKILGNATTLLFTGVISKQLPAGVTQAQAIARLKAQGQTQLAAMLSGMKLTPGAGVDLNAIAGLLLILAFVYILSAVFG